MNEELIKAAYYLVNQVQLYLVQGTIRTDLISASERVKNLLDNLSKQ